MHGIREIYACLTAQKSTVNTCTCIYDFVHPSTMISIIL